MYIYIMLQTLQCAAQNTQNREKALFSSVHDNIYIKLFFM